MDPREKAFGCLFLQVLVRQELFCEIAFKTDKKVLKLV
jgi:hypothetical protein